MQGPGAALLWARGVRYLPPLGLGVDIMAAEEIHGPAGTTCLAKHGYGSPERVAEVGGYVLDAGGVMLSGYDGKREAYDTAGETLLPSKESPCRGKAWWVSASRIPKKILCRHLAGHSWWFLGVRTAPRVPRQAIPLSPSSLCVRPLRSVVASCMGKDRENDGALPQGFHGNVFPASVRT